MDPARRLGPLLSLCIAGCAAVSPTRPAPPAPAPNPTQAPFPWAYGEPLMQGFVGVSLYDKVSREGGSSVDVDGDAGEADELPLFGGGAQWKLAGDNLTFGLEGLFSVAGRSNASAFTAGGGGAAIPVDVDLLVMDLYGGPFVSTFLGDKVRVYAGAGPLFEYADYEQDILGSHDSGSGFGLGAYARTGLEIVTHSGTMIGVGVRWSDSSVDLGADLGRLELEGFQALVTVSRTL